MPAVSSVTAWATAVIAFATVINLLVSILLWRATKASAEATKVAAEATLKIFESSLRPYVTAHSVIATSDAEQRILRFRVAIQNVGTVPAHKLTWKADARLNGNALPRNQVYDDENPTTVLFPNVQSWMDGFISAATYDAVLAGLSRLEMDIEVTYFGLADEQEYTYKESRRYHPPDNAFVIKRASAT